MLLLVVGKTSSGKDTLSNYLKDEYGFDTVISYTTRGKRECEVDGREHFFVSHVEMDILEKRNDLIAWTKTPQGIRYCAVEGSMKGSDMVYIINPDGIKWLEENRPDLEFKTLYVDLDDSSIIERAVNRGDDTETLLERLGNEIPEFEGFRDRQEYDYIIDTSGSIEETRMKADEIMSLLGKERKECLEKI